jgi:hydrogenase expression/formation protein HypE
MDKKEKILLGHGSGGKMMHELVSGHFAPAFGIEGVADAAVLEAPEGSRIALSTDSYVVSPLFFPGGDIGDLAVNGTVNDLSMVGAKPLYLTTGFIIEEGFPMAELDQIIKSMAEAARKAGVKIVAGDTKVVDRGKGDGVFINTAGVGVLPSGVDFAPSNIKPGDHIIVSGSIGRHGVAVMGERNGLSFEPQITSDSAALNMMVGDMLEKHGQIRVLRDPTRGGIATTLKEFAMESGLCLRLEEDEIPVEPGVRGACDLLGLDPLYVANEGTLLAVVAPDVSEYLLEIMQAHPEGKGAKVIGAVEESSKGAVLLTTAIGGSRIVDMLQGEQLPRIC